ncbi:MAG: hypothetical protein IT261_14645, partial [Saprospiraceae bacterium]|nr:hypothetical protein [Saprospiraceae bacterium]
MIWKTVILILGFSLAWQGVNAQANKAKQLEQQVQNATGAEKIELLIALADAQMYAGEMAAAIKTADKAEDLAEDLRMPELRANALNREGKAILLSGKRRPEQKFEQSLKLLRDIRSNNKALALDNLENLREIAKKSGKTKLEQQYESQILRLKSGGVVAEGPVESRQEIQQELTAAQRQLLENQSKFHDAQNKMLQESKALQEELAAREAEL